jgi:O-antigen/teichoic acid export membrane protein
MENNPQQAGVLSKSIQGGKWMLLSSITQKSLSLVTFFILARLLLPADYGVMAVVFIIVQFFTKLTEYGFETALIQKKESIEKYFDVVFTVNVLKSLFVFAVIYIFAVPISSFFHIPEAVNLIKLSGLLSVLIGLGNVRQLVFFKEFDFKKVFYRDFSSQLAFTLTAIGYVVFIEATVWALFYGHVARLFISTMATYVLLPVIPKISFQFKRLLDLMAYSKWIFGKSLVLYGLGMIDSILVGRMLNPVSLGFYSRSRDLSSTATMPVIQAVTKVSFSSYSRLQDKLDKIQEGFLKTIDVLMLFAVPFSLILILEGGAIVMYLLGANWFGVIVPLKILSFVFLIMGFSEILAPLFDGVGRPDITFRARTVQLIFSIIFVYFGIKFYGVNGAAFGLLGSSFVILFYMILKGREFLHIGKEKFMPAILSAGFSVIIVFALDLILRYTIHDSLSNFYLVIWSVFLGIVYLISIWSIGGLFKFGPKHTLITILKELGK